MAPVFLVKFRKGLKSINVPFVFDRVNNKWVFEGVGIETFLENIFPTKLDQMAAIINGKTILLHESFRPSPFHSKSNGADQFKLTQFGIPVADIISVEDKINPLRRSDLADNDVIVDIVERGSIEQLPELTVDVNSIKDYPVKDIKVDISIENVSESAGTVQEPIFKRFELEKWKNLIPSYVNPDNLSVFDNFSGNFRKVKLSGTDLDFKYMKDAETNELIPVKTFMKFRTSRVNFAPSSPETDPASLPYIISSLKHQLTDVGRVSLQRLELSIMDRHLRWCQQNTEYVAPAVSLCQSSGYGKTKLSIEMLKLHLGFYLVFRAINQTGYPFDNPLSRQLYQIISQYNDTSQDQSNLKYSSSTVGKILFFFSKIAASYLRSVAKMSSDLHMKQKIPVSIAVNEAIQTHAEYFFDNDKLLSKFELLPDNEVEKICRSLLDMPDDKAILVVHLESLLAKILSNSVACVDFTGKQDKEKKLFSEICSELNFKRQSFPFVFVLDEADILSKLEFTQNDLPKRPTVTGFEVLRRALGYFPKNGNFFFLTLGTKSDVVNLNPPIIDMSSRFEKGKVIPKPITLSSNANIFSKMFPITKINPSYSLLKNPLMFKFLATLGHGVWSSFQFDLVVDAAVRKLRNGSSLTKSYFLPVWMIRTGLSSNPLNIETRSLVANHMATLIDLVLKADLSEGIKHLTVTYPSEPVLAMAARELISETNSGDDLFRVLKEKSEAVSIDIGKFAEAFGGMMVLRAIDKAVNCADSLTEINYDKKVKEITELVPEFKNLWEFKHNLLENEEQNDSTPCVKFTSVYKVTTVRSMLQKLIGMNDYKLDQLGIPTETLDGLVNASHFVRLTRDRYGFLYSDLKLMPRDLPVADKRANEKSCNVIDRALLETGLIRQCGFSVPANYYGYDFVIPVMLKNKDLTFIGIQIKNSKANFSDDVYKMQGRFHLVKCSQCAHTGKCKHCLSKTYLQSIYGNQISILISLDENPPSIIKSSIAFNEGIMSSDDKSTLAEALNGKKDIPEVAQRLVKLEGKSESFKSPLAQGIVPLSKNVAIVKSLWCDDNVNLSKKFNDKFIKSDGMVHRQFCVVTRGWKVFEPLYSMSPTGFQAAHDLLSDEGIFKNSKNRADAAVLRGVLYDTAPGYFQYADEIQVRRGQDVSNFDLVNSLEKRENETALNIAEEPSGGPKAKAPKCQKK